MVVTIVHVQVKPECVAAFEKACIANHNQSVLEAGNHRFDVLKNEEDPCKFVLYEAYESKAHAAAHKETAHYLAWRETVAEMMAEPRKGIAYKAIRPSGYSAGSMF